MTLSAAGEALLEGLTDRVLDDGLAPVDAARELVTGALSAMRPESSVR